MNITVRLFASLRDLLRTSEMAIVLADGSTLADLLTALEVKEPRFASVSVTVYAAVNGKYVDEQTVLHPGDVVALFPPVSGGESSSLKRFFVTGDPLSLDHMAQMVNNPAMGAITLFAGVVRGVTDGERTDYLEYEAYREMAESSLAQIAAEVQQRWPDIADIAIGHRVGRLGVGEPSVVIAVAAPHRLHTFDACHYIIDRIKEVTPIWKKEIRGHGGTWVHHEEHVGFADWENVGTPAPVRRKGKV